MSNLDDVAKMGAFLIAHGIPAPEPAKPITDPRAAPRSTHPRLWAYTDHRSMAEVIADEIGTPAQRHVWGEQYDAHATLSHPKATDAQRELAAKAIARWGI